MDEQDPQSRDELAAKQARVSGSWQLRADNEAASKVESMSRLILPTEDGLIYIPHGVLLMLAAEGSYTEVHLEDGRKLLVSKGLGKLYRCLPPALFHRCHDSYVVNLAHVVRLIRHGGYRVELRGGLMVRVARRRWGAMGAAMERLSK